VCGDERVEKEVTANTRISVLKSMLSKAFKGVPIRRRKLLISEEDGNEVEIGDRDGGRDLGWFLGGRKAVVTVV
jgi:hypothetical protein